MIQPLLAYVNATASILKHKDDHAPGSGTHRKDEPLTLEALQGAFVPAAVIAIAYLSAFLLIRPRFLNQYSPRTYFRTIPEKDRTPSTSTSILGWFRDFRRLDDLFVLRHHSFDAYLFLRFFRVLILISVVGTLLTWPVLFPLHATGGGNATELDRLGFGNIADSNRLWGHTIVATIFLGFILLLVTRERVFLINFRQAYLTTKPTAHRLSSRTVLFLSVPRETVEDGTLESLFGENMRRMWRISRMKQLESLVDSRNSKVFELEAAELKLAQNVSHRMRNKSSTSNNINGSDPEIGRDNAISDTQARPTQREPPLVGKKLDSIDKLLHTLPDINDAIEEQRKAYSEGKKGFTRAVFVEFKDQLSAHQALQLVQYHAPLSLQPRYVGLPPKDIIWSNLTIDPALRFSYIYAATAIFMAIIILWSIPVGFVATISNIDYLTNKIKWLSFIDRLPPSIIGFIKGFLPPYLLSLLVSYVPFWFKDIARKFGEPTAQDVEKVTQNWYFVFQVVQVFLVTTFSSGAATIVTRIANRPGTIPDLLARNLPKASNFYLTYFVLQGLGSTTSLLIKYTDVFQYFFWRYLAKTPRQKYENELTTKGFFEGNQYPKFTNMAVIAITYSCIAPLVLGFAAVGLTLFYFTYRYLFLYANIAKLDTRGACYVRALQHLMTGVYLSELCLIGLFSARNSKGPSVCMVVVLILTVLYHITVNKYLSPLEETIPLDVLARKASETDEERTSASASNDQSAPLLETSSPATDLFAHSTSNGGNTRGHHIPIKPLNKTLTLNVPSWVFFKLPFNPISFLLSSPMLPAPAELRPYLIDPDHPASTPQYTDTQLNNAYLPPYLTSKPPIVWLAEDSHGIGTTLAERNKELAGLETSVGGGVKLTDKGDLDWKAVRKDFSKSPIFKGPSPI